MGRVKLLRIEEVAVLIGTSCKTINSWYMFKRRFPNNEFAQMLPEYIQNKPRQTRYWKESDIPKFLRFSRSIPKGRGGVMGDITQQWIRKKKAQEVKYE